MLKTSLANKLLSLAVTLTSKAPTLETPGVPENVLVAGLNDNHVGRVAPFEREAL
jgi:hypothetical protein